MTFALTAVRIEEALQEPGCPVCRLARQAAEHSVDSFLWEHVNDPQVRQRIIEAYGFCPEHTLLLAATEMASSGPVVGVNIIYEQLGRVVSRDLRRAIRWEKPSGAIRLWLARLGIRPRRRRAVLPPKGPCPVCELADQAGRNILSALFSELEDPHGSIRRAYHQSDGLCLLHLRLGLEQWAWERNEAGQFLIQDCVERLERLSQHMKEYLRKNNWEYRDEALTDEESRAWRQMLTFFTGYPGSRFTFRQRTDEHGL